MSKKQKNIGVKALCSVLIILLIATISIAIPSKGFTDWSKFKKNPQVEQPNKPGEEQKPGGGGDNIDVEQIETNGVLLSMATATADDGTVSKIITATVLPEDAPDKSVDWSIYWADDAPLKDKDISEYLTLTPTADGALTATVTCKKSFRGSVAIIKVETRSGGHHAICMASYDGIPTSITVGNGQYGLVEVTGASDVRAVKRVYGVTDNNKFAISLDNVFGDVGESYYSQYTISAVTSYGQIVLDDATEDRSGFRFHGKEKTVDLSTIQNQLIDVTCDGKNISVTVKKDITSYYESVQATSSSGATYTGYYKKTALKNGIAPYFEVTLTNTYLNQSVNVKFWFQIDVTGVSLSNTSITF